MSSSPDNGRLERFLANPRRAVWVLAAPTIGGMLLHVVYNVTDTAFVGRIGSHAIAGLTIVFPLLFVMIALSNGVGSGITVLIAQAIGRRDHQAERKLADEQRQEEGGRAGGQHEERRQAPGQDSQPHDGQ